MPTKQNLTGYPSIDKPWLKYYSEEAINAKLPECSVYEYLWESNKDYLDNVALSYMGTKIKFRELFENIEKTAKAFYALGLREGDVVVIASVATPETVYAFYALDRLGVISNMVDPRTSIEGIHEYICEVDAKHVFVIDAAYEKICKAIEGTKVKHVIITSPVESLTGAKKHIYNMVGVLKDTRPKLSKDSIKWSEFILAGGNAIPELAEYEKNRCCVIVHTGGTTGNPKGVMLSDDNINALVCQSIWTGIDMKREHTWLDIMPPFIAYGVGMGLHLPLSIGMETILIPKFDAKKFDELLLKHKPIHMVGVPSYWGTIINSKKMQKEDLSYIIAPTVGGDTMDPVLEKKANEFLKSHGCSYGITKGYGMTEVSAGVTGTLDAINEIGSVGVPFVKSIVSIFDPITGEELTYGKEGEVCICSPNIMLGYYGNEEATNNIIKIHKDGTRWIHSGDIGYMKDNGSLFLVDRKKRMIIRYDGFKVFPSFIENVVSEHKDIETCCAVGTQDTAHSQGKLPVVYEVLKHDCENERQALESELAELCKNELPEYAQPVAFKFIEKMPLTPIGKVDYRALEDMEDESHR